MTVIKLVTFEEALQDQQKLLQFWLQGQNYVGAWEELRRAIVNHIEKIKAEQQLATYNKIIIFEELQKITEQLKAVNERLPAAENSLKQLS